MPLILYMRDPSMVPPLDAYTCSVRTWRRPSADSWATEMRVLP